MTAPHAHPDEPRDEGCGDCGKRLSQPDEHESGLCLRCLNGPLTADRVGPPCGVCRGRVAHAPDCPAASQTGQDTTLREEIARWMCGVTDWQNAAECYRDYWRGKAAELLALPSVRRLLDPEARAQAAEAKVAAVEALADELQRESDELKSWDWCSASRSHARRIRSALDGQP